jgi:CRP-like cAMP-binding protein
MSLWQRLFSSSKDTPASREEAFLKHVSFLKSLNPRELRMLMRYLHLRSYAAGEFIFKEDFPHVVVFLVLEGEVELLPHRNAQNSMMTLGPHHFLGLIEMFTGTKRLGSAIAKTDCQLYAISKFDFKDYIKQNPRTGVKILYGINLALARMLSSTIYPVDEEICDEDS